MAPPAALVTAAGTMLPPSLHPHPCTRHICLHLGATGLYQTRPLRAKLEPFLLSPKGGGMDIPLTRKETLEGESEPRATNQGRWRSTRKDGSQGNGESLAKVLKTAVYPVPCGHYKPSEAWLMTWPEKKQHS